MRKLGIVLAAVAAGLLGSLGMSHAQLMFDPAVHHLKAETDFEYDVIAPEFFRNIFIRKIEAEDIEISTPTLYNISFEDVGEAELTFVAIRPRTYEFGVETMKQRGMVGKIIIEASGDN